MSALKINVDMMRAMYDYFAHSEPFASWNMPPVEDIKFHIKRTARLYGWYAVAVSGRGRNRKVEHHITISSGRHGHTDTFTRTMAHEMIHLIEERNCLSVNAAHGPVFKKLAQEVAEHHGFDPLAL